MKENVINAIRNLKEQDLSIENVIKYIDYTEKVRYTDVEIINVLLKIIKTMS